MKEKKPQVRVGFVAPTEFKLRFRRVKREKPIHLASGLRVISRLSRASSRTKVQRRALPGARGHLRSGSAARQRVTVKAYFSKVKDAFSGVRSIRQYARYLAREGKGIDGLSAPFRGTGSVGSLEDIVSYPNEAHYFRLIVSPERSPDLDMNRFVDEFVDGLEKDLKTKLIWNAVIHYNTDTPHAHILVRGVTDKGDTLVIDKAYIKHGMRELARDIATRHLGLRTEQELKEVGERELRADRVTALDREFFGALKRSETGTYRVPVLKDLKRTFERTAFYRKLARLQYLKELGLASEISPGEWSLKEGTLETLKKLSIRNDVLALIHEKVRGAHFGHSMLTSDSPELEGEGLIGEVIDKGLIDGPIEKKYLIVSGANGVAYYVGLDRFSETEGFESKPGALVRIRVPKGGRGDSVISEFSRKNNGRFNLDSFREAISAGVVSLPKGVDKESYLSSFKERFLTLERHGVVTQKATNEWEVGEGFLARVKEFDSKYNKRAQYLFVDVLSHLPLKSQVKALGPTFLDRVIEQSGGALGGETLSGPFKERLMDAVFTRISVLKERSVELKKGMARELQKEALRVLQDRIGGQFGPWRELRSGHTYEGTVISHELVGDKYVTIVGAENGAYVVPAGNRTKRLEKGTSVTLSLREIEGRNGVYRTPSIEPKSSREQTKDKGMER